MKRTFIAALWLRASPRQASTAWSQAASAGAAPGRSQPQGRRHGHVYVFPLRQPPVRCSRHPEGVIATDPIGYGRPQAVVTYVEEIRKVTDKRFKYLIYSHHHYDHIAGRQAVFQDAARKIIAHKKAKERSPSSRSRHAAPRRDVPTGRGPSRSAAPRSS